VHLGTSDLPLQRYLIAIDIPDRIWRARVIVETELLPTNWNISPPNKSSIDFGNAWIKSEKSVVMSLPSVIVPEDSIFLINPMHKDVSLINAVVMRKWEYDVRLFS
jgi:RES domain-containing protein